MDYYFKFSNHYSLDKRISFLCRAGFEVRLEKKSFSVPVYHNDMEDCETEVYCVYKNGKYYNKPGGYSFGREDWVDNVFNEVMFDKMLEL